MEKYNMMQRLLMRYCRQRHYTDYEITGTATCSATDPEGQKKRLTVNVFGDIMDNDIKRIIAVGKVSHDIRMTYEFPYEWIDVEPIPHRELGDYREKKPRKTRTGRRKNRSDPER